MPNGCPGVPGGFLTFSGTVSNSGNVNLTNIVVTSHVPVSNTVVFTAASGDQIWCIIDGAFTSQATAEGTYTVNGGTGRFENETGSASFSVIQSDPSNFSFEFTGKFGSN